MAIYHSSVKPVQRSKGRSATAAAAYRSGEKVHDKRTDKIFDYTRKQGVEHTEIIGTSLSREQLWNLAEGAEKRKDAVTAKEYELALPQELSLDQNIILARDYAEKLHEKHGCAVDICIHAAHTDKEGTSNNNRHAHLLTTNRPIIQAGTALSDIKCEREWSNKKRRAAGLCFRNEDVIKDREMWADCVNSVLEDAGEDDRVDHRTLEAQGILRKPQIHLGPTVTAMQRKGKQSDRGDRNEKIKKENEELARLQKIASEFAKDVDDLKWEIDQWAKMGDDFDPDFYGEYEPEADPELKSVSPIFSEKEKRICRTNLELTQKRYDVLDADVSDLKFQLRSEKYELSRIESRLDDTEAKHKEKSFLKRTFTKTGENYKSDIAEYQQKKRDIQELEEKVQEKGEVLKTADEMLTKLEAKPIAVVVKQEIALEKEQAEQTVIISEGVEAENPDSQGNQNSNYRNFLPSGGGGCGGGGYQAPTSSAGKTAAASMIDRNNSETENFIAEQEAEQEAKDKRSKYRRRRR